MTITSFFLHAMGPNSIIGWLWLIVALGFLALELSTPGLFFFIAFAIGSFGAGIVAFLGRSLPIQCISGFTIALVSFFTLRCLCASRAKQQRAKTNSDALVGKQGVVTRQINVHQRGYVKIGGEVWSARSEHGETFSQESTIRVIRIEGNTLIVSTIV